MAIRGVPTKHLGELNRTWVRIPLSLPFSGIQACPLSGRPVNSRSYALVAQSVECVLGKHEVTGSIPVESSKSKYYQKGK